MRIVFAGTPEFAAAHLAALLEAGETVAAVYTQPDRPAGRGQRLRESPVKQLAAARGIPVLQPESLRGAEAAEALAHIAPDLMVVVAYGLLLPRAVLATPRLGCVNVHASLLPRWRGAAPIQRAILAGDTESGVSLMQMDEGLDIAPRDTAATLHDRLAALGARALVQLVRDLRESPVAAVPQTEAGVTYARKIERAEAEIDWQDDAAAIERRVRAFNPWPVARTTLGGEILRVWEAEALGRDGDRARGGDGPGALGGDEDSARGGDGPRAEPGEVLAAGREGIEVAAGAGRLRITGMQLPGGRPIRAADYLNAHPSPVGAVLGRAH